VEDDKMKDIKRELIGFVCSNYVNMRSSVVSFGEIWYVCSLCLTQKRGAVCSVCSRKQEYV